MAKVEVEQKRTLGQILHDNRVRKINRLYAIYRLDPSENNMNDLLKEVIKLATRKMRQQAKEFGEVALENEEDFAQRVAITVWEKLPIWNGKEFYPWLVKTIVFHRQNMFKELKACSKLHVPMVLADEDGNEYDNPVIYADTGVVDTSVRIPEGLDEDDELICYMIAERKPYADIAQYLGVGVRTIERRVAELKERYGKEIQVA